MFKKYSPPPHTLFLLLSLLFAYLTIGVVGIIYVQSQQALVAALQVEPVTANTQTDATTRRLEESLATADKQPWWEPAGNHEQIVAHNNRYFIAANPPADNSSQRVFWKDITPAHGALTDMLKSNLWYAFSVYTLIEILLFLGLRKALLRPAKTSGQQGRQITPVNRRAPKHSNKTIAAIDEGRMLLFAQVITPISQTSTKKLRYEVLVRQRAPDGKILSPAQFLPAIERHNLAAKLDFWVITQTFHLLHKHRENISHIEHFSINLSGQSLGDAKIYELIVQLLDSTRVAAKQIIFEITETIAIANITLAISFISALKKHGCRFSLDDFGSGFSSFMYLKQLPVDYLKIDGFFIKDINEDPIDFAMVKSINEMGHLMGLETIAEFVEDDKILHGLKTIGVDYAQGYGLGKPQPLGDFF